MKRLANRTAVITGAASGIGRATAQALAERGCHLALADIDAEGLAATKSLIAADHRDLDIRTYDVDVGDAERVERFASQVIDDFGAAHILVNNAGINVTARFEEHSLDDFRRTFDVNLWGVIHGCRSFMPHLRAADEAHIVNISSLFGILGTAGQAAYTASKFAVRGLSESLHEELASTSVGVSVVHPGCVDTNIVHSGKCYDPDQAEQIRQFFAKNGCSPDVVARRIVEAVESDAHRVLVTRETYVIDWIRRLMPTRGNRLAHRFMARFSGIDFEV